MTSRRTHAAWLAGICGAVSPIVLIAAWVAVVSPWRSPASRLAAFIDPGSVHRVHASGIILEASVGILIGLAISLLVARAARGERWLACIVFLLGFAAAWVIPAALHDGWVHLPRTIARPLLLAFVVAAVAGFCLDPLAAGSRTLKPHLRG